MSPDASVYLIQRDLSRFCCACDNPCQASIRRPAPAPTEPEVTEGDLFTEEDMLAHWTVHLGKKPQLGAMYARHKLRLLADVAGSCKREGGRDPKAPKER